MAGLLAAACGGGGRWSKGHAMAPALEAAPMAQAPGHGAMDEDADGQPFGEAAHNTESYDHIVENDFLAVAKYPLSTFSIDVDTASYSNVRRFLAQGSLPPKDAVRIEELVNYFRYEYPQPTGQAPFSVTSEVGEAPWNAKHRLVHIGLQGKEMARGELPPQNLVFLLDVSGSMAEPNKLPLLKRSLGELIETLGEKDRVAIVVYAGASGLVLPSTPATERAKITDALERLEAGGSTNGGEGIELAYRTARKAMTRDGINRVVLATDGDFNVGVTSEGDLVRLIEEERKSGVFLTVLGFGMGNYKDATLEKLADKGNGNYAYIDTLSEARKVLVEEAGATFVTIAKDVKIQVEFNPKHVGAYRLIGYENRMLRNEDFNDDAKDAGDIGAGHSVTALYEIIPVGVRAPSGSVDPLKYQTAGASSAAAASNELMTVKLRYKEPDGLVSGRRASRGLPDGAESRLLSFTVDRAVRPLAETSENFRFGAAVAGFGMLLRDSKHKGSASWSTVSTLAKGAMGSDTDGYRRELLGMIDAAKRLSPGAVVAR